MNDKIVTIALIIPLICAMIFSLYMAVRESDISRQNYIICISAGGSWKDGDCRLMVPEKPK